MNVGCWMFPIISILTMPDLQPDGAVFTRLFLHQKALDVQFHAAVLADGDAKFALGHNLRWKVDFWIMLGQVTAA